LRVRQKMPDGEIHIPQPGQKLVEPQALFTKLDDEIIEKETQKLGH